MGLHLREASRTCEGPAPGKSISRHLAFLGRDSLLRGFLFFSNMFYAGQKTRRRSRRSGTFSLPASPITVDSLVFLVRMEGFSFFFCGSDSQTLME